MSSTHLAKQQFLQLDENNDNNDNVTGEEITHIDISYTPSDNEEYMNPKHLEYFRRRLMFWKSELQSEMLQFGKQLQTESTYDADATDRAASEIAMQTDMRTHGRISKLIHKINDALVRIKEKKYGYCEDTFEEIGLKRLMARPIATRCIVAQEKYERFEKAHNKYIPVLRMSEETNNDNATS